MAYKPATSSDDAVTRAINETVWGDHGMSESEKAYYSVDVLKYGGIDDRTIQGHNEWIENMAPWSRRAIFSGQDIEPQPPSGWLFRFPSAIPVREDARTITEYGPRDYLPYDGHKINYYHTSIATDAQPPRLVDQLPFMRYDIR